MALAQMPRLQRVALSRGSIHKSRRKAPVDMSRARSLGTSERVRVWEGAVRDQRSSVVRMGTVHAVSFSIQFSNGISLTR
jgi:hypothetical protein